MARKILEGYVQESYYNSLWGCNIPEAFVIYVNGRKVVCDDVNDAQKNMDIKYPGKYKVVDSTGAEKGKGGRA